jgi:hypothetical protein
MAKRDSGTRQAKGATTTVDSIEQRVAAFAEQLGQMARSLQARAGGRMDRTSVKKQIAAVRSSATRLLEQVAAKATKAPARKPVAAATRGGTIGGNRGRSGGAVDAPGKRHRKQSPPDPNVNIANSQAVKTRAARTMAKTYRRRGRG